MSPKTKPCSRCKGKGTINGMKSLDHSGATYKPMTCPKCEGTGKVPVKEQK